MPNMTTIYPLHIPMILQFLGFCALAIIFCRYIWHHLYICYFWMESMWDSHWRCCPCFALLLNSLIGNNGFLWNFKYKSCAYHFCLLIMSSFFFFFLAYSDPIQLWLQLLSALISMERLTFVLFVSSLGWAQVKLAHCSYVLCLSSIY